MMTKILAFDIGEKRIGIARSENSFAFPLFTIKVNGGVVKQLEKVIRDEKPDKIVVGLPRNMDGTLGFQAEKVKEFAETNLAKHREIIEYEDESATSIEAEKMMELKGKNPKKDKDLIDAYAAKIILESWMARN